MLRSFFRTLLLVLFTLIGPSLHAKFCENFLKKVSNFLILDRLSSRLTIYGPSYWPEEVTETWRMWEDRPLGPEVNYQEDLEPYIGDKVRYANIGDEGKLVSVGKVRLYRISDLRPNQVRVINFLRAKSRLNWGKQREVGVWIAVAEDGRQFLSDLATSNEKFEISRDDVNKSLISLESREGVDLSRFRSFHFVHTHPGQSGPNPPIDGALLSVGDVRSQWYDSLDLAHQIGGQAIFHIYAVSTNPKLDLISHYSSSPNTPRPK